MTKPSAKEIEFESKIEEIAPGRYGIVIPARVSDWLDRYEGKTYEVTVLTKSKG